MYPDTEITDLFFHATEGQVSTRPFLESRTCEQLGPVGMVPCGKRRMTMVRSLTMEMRQPNPMLVS